MRKIENPLNLPRCNRCRRPMEDGVDTTRSTLTHSSCLDSAKISRQKANRTLKRTVMEHYGGAVCVCCNEWRLSMLTLDHIDGGGIQHRLEAGGNGTRFYQFLKRMNYPSGLQVMCSNCNHSKFICGGICEHKLGLVD